MIVRFLIACLFVPIGETECSKPRLQNPSAAGSICWHANIVIEQFRNSDECDRVGIKDGVSECSHPQPSMHSSSVFLLLLCGLVAISVSLLIHLFILAFDIPSFYFSDCLCVEREASVWMCPTPAGSMLLCLSRSRPDVLLLSTCSSSTAAVVLWMFPAHADSDYPSADFSVCPSL